MERKEAVAPRTVFVADSAVTEIAGAYCEVRQGARQHKVKTPAKLAFAVTHRRPSQYNALQLSTRDSKS